MAKAPIIQVKRVSKTYNSNVVALKNVSFKIHEGEFVSIIGPNGCGKTTLIYMLSNLLKPSSGEIVTFGKPIGIQKLSSGIIFQDYRKSLFNWRTVYRNIEFPLETMGVPETEREDRIKKYLKLLKLEGFEHHYPAELSGGMQQKVAIARALVYDPDVLFLDEPFASLDPQTRLGLQTELTRIWRVTKRTIVFVTHNIDEAIYVGNRIIVLTKRPGKVKKTMNVRLPYPRNPSILSKKEFSILRSSLWKTIREEINEI